MITYGHAEYDEVKTLAGPHAKNVGFSPRSVYVAARDGDKVVGAAGYLKRGAVIELCSAVVLPEYRHRGIYSQLFRFRSQLIAKIPHRKEVAFCTKYSLGRLMAEGFSIVREYRISTKVEKTIAQNGLQGNNTQGSGSSGRQVRLPQ